MKPPLKLHAALDDVPLTSDEAVRAKVAGLSVAWDLPLGGGIWALRLPVAVVDSRPGRRRWVPVVDPNMALGGAVLAFGAISALRRLRRRGHGERRGGPTEAE